MAAGRLWLPDGESLAFDAAADLRIDGAHRFIIVTDADADGQGEVEAVETLPTDHARFWVLVRLTAIRTTVAGAGPCSASAANAVVCMAFASRSLMEAPWMTSCLSLLMLTVISLQEQDPS